jgi:hypothetical protein
MGTFFIFLILMLKIYFYFHILVDQYVLVPPGFGAFSHQRRPHNPRPDRNPLKNPLSENFSSPFVPNVLAPPPPEKKLRYPYISTFDLV